MAKWFERGFVIFTLLLFAGALSPSDAPEAGKGSVSEQGNELINFLLRGDLVLLLIISTARFQRLIKHWRSALWPLALAGFALMSTAWSTNPEVTLKRGLIFLGITLFGIYLGSCFEADEQMALISSMLSLAILGCFLTVALFPQYGISHDVHWGAWKGLFEHKNALGSVMVLALITFGMAPRFSTVSPIRILSLLGAVILLALSRSATAVALAVGLLGITFILPMIRAKRKGGLAIAAVVFPALLSLIWIAFQNTPLILKYLGRDSTLTGRVYVWKAVLFSIAQRPWLGYGYQAYFSRFAGDSMIVVAMTGGFNPSHSHNGYFDLLLDMGLIGFCLFFGGLAVSFFRATQLFRSSDGSLAKWHLLFLVFFVSCNFTESFMLRPMTFLYVPYVVCVVSLGRLSQQARETRRLRRPGAALVRGYPVVNPLALVPGLRLES